MTARIFLTIAVTVAGCGKPSAVATTVGNTAASNPAARVTAAPIVPDNPNLAGFVGDWEDADGTVVSITRNADGSATISLPPNDTWDSVVNDARLDGPNLRYDFYMYLKSNGDHPYNGVRNDVTLSKGDAPDTLKLRVVTKDLPQGDVSVLRRSSKP